MDGSAGQPRRAALAFVFVTVALDILALGIIIPVLPGLVLRFVGGDTVQAAEIYGVFGTVWALMQFLFSPVLGALSDRFGRRPVILLSNFGLGLDYIVMALAPTLPWLFVGRILSGITAASFSTASAYIADVTPAEKRAGAFGVLGMAFGAGFVLGPALGGLLGGVDPRLPFWVAAGLSLANGMYGLFVLPESLPKERRAAWSWKRASPLGSLALLRRHPMLTGMAAAAFLANLAHFSLPSTFVLYAGYRYSWDETDVGLALAGVGVGSAVVQGGLVRPIVGRIGERAALLVGLVSGACGFAIYGLAPTGALFLLGVPVMAFWGLSGPAGQGIMTRLVGPDEQGRLQGAVSGLMGIAGIVGPGIFAGAFSRCIGEEAVLHLPGVAFVMAGGMMLLAMGIAAWVTRGHAPAPAGAEAASAPARH
jgi:DHA1 family tetracycline resistance protein-like MFS transporter